MSKKPKASAPKEETTPTLVPKLRFPEFRKAEGWKKTELGNVCQILDNRRRPITGSERQPGPYPYYGASGIVDFIDDFIFDERLLLVGEDGAKWDAFQRTAFIAEGKFWVNNHAHVLKPFAIADTLLENYLTMIDLAPFVSGAAPPKLTLGKLKSIPVPVPSTPDEQQKIAECLSSVDELIAAQARKVDALKTQKKGLMQQLFPREGETQPRLRFPEFRGQGDWEITTIGQLGEVVTGSTPSTSRSEYYGGDKMFVSPADISDGRFIEKTRIGLTTLGFEKTRTIRAKSVLFVCIGSTIGKIAQNRYECATNQQINSVVPSAKHADGFLYYSLSQKAGRIAKLAGKQAVPIVNKSLFSSVELLILTLPEQHRIASCLGSWDELITAEGQKLEGLKTHKRGLMQQLFPSAVEA